MIDAETKFERIYNRSPNFFNLGNIQICIDPYIFVFLGVFFSILVLISQIISNSSINTSLLDCVIIVSLAYIVIFMHELGHLVVRLHQGCRVECILLSYNACCVVSDIDDNELSDTQLFIGTLAGPLTNLILCILCIFIALVASACVNEYMFKLLYGFMLANGLCFCINMFNLHNFDSDGYKIYSYLKWWCRC